MTIRSSFYLRVQYNLLLAAAFSCFLALSMNAASIPKRVLSPGDMASNPQLPDPFQMMDGRVIRTAKEWNTLRRLELKELFQTYMYGQMPPPPGKIRVTRGIVDSSALNGRATLQMVTLSLGSAEAPKMDLLIYLPNHIKSSVPLFLAINFYGNHQVVDDPRVPLPKSWVPKSSTNILQNRASEKDRGAQIETWSVEQTIERGYGFATFYNGDVEPDNKDNSEEGIRAYYRKLSKGKKTYDWGAVAAWAWGFQRAVDFLKTEKRIDAKRIAVVGHSRNGKAAMVAAAFDERIALAIPLQAGCGGTAPSRGTVGEQVKQINDRFPHWFNDTFKQFNDAPARLPIDQHLLVALCAPRPVLFPNAVEDTWANPKGQFEVLAAASPVYQLIGKSGLESTQPPPTSQLLNSRLGYFIRPGKHSMTKNDWTIFLDYADKWLR